MEWETCFRLLNGLLLGVFTLIRIPYVILSIREAANPDDKRTAKIYSVISILIVAAGFYYLAAADFLQQFAIDLPLWIRLSGLGIGVIGCILLLWTHKMLGKSFSMFVSSTTKHKLIISGPYKWIRHPMYSAFLLIALAFFLLASNLFFAGFIAVMIYPLIYRVSTEEVYLIKTFGTPYADYMNRTKKFIPFIY